jgi:hypothetical protein
MPKLVKWGTDADTIDEVEVKDSEDFEPYDGPMPPKGMILRCDVKRVTHEKFSTGNYGIKVLAVVNDPAKSKYDGLAYWDNITDTPANAWKIRQWMDAIGGVGKDWMKTAIEEVDGLNQVVKFGKIRVEGLAIRVQHKTGRYEDQPKAEIGRYMPRDEAKLSVKPKGRSGNEDDDDEDDSEPPF